VGSTVKSVYEGSTAKPVHEGSSQTCL
jgi:hypothetical protein